MCLSYATLLIRSASLASVLNCCLGIQIVRGAEANFEATELLPNTVIAVAEVPVLSDIVSTVMEHPLRQRLMDLPSYEAVLNSPQFKQLKRGISAFEGSMQQPWREALRTLTAGGITVAVDTQANGGVALLAKSSDAESLVRFRDFLLAMQLLRGKSAQQGEYRGVSAYTLTGNQKLVLLDDWFVLVNKPELGKSIIDRYLDGEQPSLKSNPRFIAAMAQRHTTHLAPPAVWAYLDIETVRQAGIAKNVFKERVDNFFAELLVGGILANIRHAPFATWAMNVEEAGVQLQIQTPHERGWEAPREYQFGDSQPAVAPPLLQVDDRLFALSTYRDLSQLWLRAGDLMDERAVDQLAKADTQLTTFFAGRDFGEDILGALDGDIQIVAKMQEFTVGRPTPAIKLPAVAVQFRPKDPAVTQTELRRVFQSFIGFLNITGAQNGQPQFDLGTETVGQGQLHTATYVPNRNLNDLTQAPINFNFSPTVGFTDDNFILSSTTALARELVMQETSSRSTPAETKFNTLATLDVREARAALASNRQQLVANNMLEKGHSPAAAEAEIGLLLEIIGIFRDAELSLDISDQHMQVQLSVAVDDAPKQP